ncbi:MULTISPECIES: VOC family protein [unclassified Rhodococcus (in: high G+C Gram-positive bacteria)]|uniref:VOC family protein n=1 Tax=unclassified Rhodococcus (in: high G+C Gram-positive bacteria) TaxID=192944 RepID=UPI0027E0F3E7|nr:MULTISPECIES: VOC family protein [unclassified Rhodococcus (in: high G+C Gram-positive bacteria)]
MRVARPTGRLTEVVAFYRDAIGLPQVAHFADHAGYDGVILGMPDAGYQLEFTSHVDEGPCPPPSDDNLLVLYFDSRAALEVVNQRCRDTGSAPVAASNPYWTLIDAVTFEDPDGWRVVLAPIPRNDT